MFSWRVKFGMFKFICYGIGFNSSRIMDRENPKKRVNSLLRRGTKSLKIINRVH